MAKRFTDTNKYKKPFIRGLQGAYKIFWDYLYHECDHAGIWIVDFDVAQHYVGNDMPITKKDALKYFNEGEKRIVEIDNGMKWFIPSFIEFQYGELNGQNRAHNSVISILKKYNIKTSISPLKAPSQGAKDKDKDMDKDMDMVKELEILPEFLPIFLNWLRYKRKRGESYKDENSTLLAYKKLVKLSGADSIKAIEVVEQSMANNYAGLFELKEQRRNGSPSQSIPSPKITTTNDIK